VTKGLGDALHGCPSSRLRMCCATLTVYAVLVQQPLDTAQADTVLLGYLLSSRAGPVQLDHGVEIPQRETITQTV